MGSYASDFVRTCDEAWFNGEVPPDQRKPVFSIDDPDMREFIDVALAKTMTPYSSPSLRHLIPWRP